MYFLNSHVEGCTASMRCVCCEARAFLQQKLTNAEYIELESLVSKRISPNTSETLPDDTSTDDLKLPTRARNALVLVAGLKTVGEIRQKSEWALVRIPRFGRGSLSILKKTLGRHGVKLAPGASVL